MQDEDTMAHEVEANAGGPRVARRARALRAWAGPALLVVLPLLLAILGFPRPELSGDADFYGYQLKRMGEVGGRWWRIADDPLLGAPYQSEVARNPGLFEGVDLLLLTALPGRFLDARYTYYLAVFTALAFNGWVAGALVRRLGGSTFWAALAVVLTTWNFSTTTRYLSHLHLVKYGWVLLAVWMFAEYLRAPTRRRGVLLGLALAGVLQGSFYFGFLLLLGLFCWWTGCLIARRVGRGHLWPTVVAGGTFALAGAALTFPVWTVAKSYYFSDDYFQRPWNETWWFSAELWQYLVPPDSSVAANFIGSVHVRDWSTYWESWHFPGRAVLLAVGLYLVARLRDWRLWSAQAHVIDVFMGLIAVFVVLSLAGGPSYFLFPVFPIFRVYGRAGMLALVLGCVAAPLVLQGALAAVRSRVLRAALLVALVGVVGYDARRAVSIHGPDLANKVEDTRKFIEGKGDTHPAWVDWLAEQPADVRLAAFAPLPPGSPFYTWGVPNLRHRLKHGHATLNGCDYRLLQGDLKLLGASYNYMNPAGLRFIVGLGYETLAFDQKYLDAHDWIRSLPWLDWVAERGDWRMARVNDRLCKFPTQTLEQLLAAQPRATPAATARAHIWITGRLAGDRDVVVPAHGRALMSWTDARGKRIGTPYNALFQHVFGPGIPAYTVETPKRPGRYDLVFCDPRGRVLASKPYQILAGRGMARPPIDKQRPAVTVNETTREIDPTDPTPLRFVLENTSSYGLSALIVYDPTCRTVRTHPGLVAAGAGSVGIAVKVESRGGRPLQELQLTLPRDLAPGDRLELELPRDRLLPAREPVRVTFAPIFVQCLSRTVDTALADVRLQLTAGPGPPLAGAGHSSPSPALSR